MRAATLILFVVIVSGCVRQPAVIQRGKLFGTVVKVIDGDTLDLLHSGTITTRIRLNGIDAPERKQAFSAKAKEHLSELIGQQPVRVVDWGPDQYGRTIGDVFVIRGPNVKEWLNASMVGEGFAWHFKRYSDDRILARAEVEARAAKRGLWADPKPVATWEWRAKERDKK